MGVDLNTLQPSALRAAMKGGTSAWGVVGSTTEHVRYSVPLPKIKARRQCGCGCEGKATHVGMANGLGLTRGCQLSMARWVRTGFSKPQSTPTEPPKEQP